MNGKSRMPKYAIRLVVLFVVVGTAFFAGLQLFVPEGSKLTGSYDAKSLLYIADQPVSYGGSKSCGAANCHAALYAKWAEGAHGAKAEQSKCEVCHGPKGNHPTKDNKLATVRGDGDIVGLCLLCHQKLKARSETSQPQILPHEHPYPHEGILKCTGCHDPHSPRIGATKPATSADKVTSAQTAASPAIAESCFSCHGPSGSGGFAPVLAGQSVKSLKEKLSKYKSGALNNPMMSPIAAALSDKDIDTLANFFANPKGADAATDKTKAVTKTSSAKTAKAEKIEKPSAADNCFSCHGPSGRDGFAPVLAGQSVKALKEKLNKYKSGAINNPMMNPVASALSEKDIDALAHYFANL